MGAYSWDQDPGWFVQINLIDTALESKPFEKTIIERTDMDWLHCFVEEPAAHTI